MVANALLLSPQLDGHPNATPTRKALYSRRHSHEYILAGLVKMHTTIYWGIHRTRSTA